MNFFIGIRNALIISLVLWTIIFFSISKISGIAIITVMIYVWAGLALLVILFYFFWLIAGLFLNLSRRHIDAKRDQKIY